MSEHRVTVVFQSRVPPPLLECATILVGKRRRATTFPHVATPQHSLSSTAACSGCWPPHLSSVFPCRSPLSRACLSTADVGRLPSPRLCCLDVASEDPSPCAASSPRRLRVGVTPACTSPARWPWRGLPSSAGCGLWAARLGRPGHANTMWAGHEPGCR
jgi:hypothetical protein